MSTRSAIGYVDDKNVIRAVYCHFDGYPKGVGKILFEHYFLEKIKELVSLGDLSELGKYIGEKHDFNDCPKDTCNFYSRDREEKNVEYKMFYLLNDFINYFDKMGCEYLYILDDSKWFVYHNETMRLLKECLGD